MASSINWWSSTTTTRICPTAAALLFRPRRRGRSLKCSPALILGAFLPFVKVRLFPTCDLRDSRGRERFG